MAVIDLRKTPPKPMSRPSCATCEVPLSVVLLSKEISIVKRMQLIGLALGIASQIWNIWSVVR